MKKLAKQYFPNYGKATIMEDRNVRQNLSKFKKFEENEEIRSNIRKNLKNFEDFSYNKLVARKFHSDNQIPA